MVKRLSPILLFLLAQRATHETAGVAGWGAICTPRPLVQDIRAIDYGGAAEDSVSQLTQATGAHKSKTMTPSTMNPRPRRGDEGIA